MNPAAPAPQGLRPFRGPLTEGNRGEVMAGMARTEYLLQKEVEHVLAALTPQNQLVCRVILHTGLRVGDVVKLKTEQLARQFSVTETKTGKRRKVGLTDWLIRKIKAQAGPVWAFPGRVPGKHKTRQAVWADVKRAAKAFRLPQNVGTHSMRKVYAVELRKKYGDLGRVQKIMKHSNATVTMIYAMADKLLEAKKS